MSSPIPDSFVDTVETEATEPITGALRDCTETGKGYRKIKEGDIAIIDAPDLTRTEAQKLIDVNPGAVVNLASFTTGSVPNFGPLMLIERGIPIFEDGGEDLRSAMKDGARKGKVTEHGTVFNGKNKLGTARPVTRAQAEQNYEDARRHLVNHMSVFSNETQRFVSEESALLIDGLGVPEVAGEINGRKVLVVSPAEDNSRDLKELRNFIQEYSPVLIGVETGADALMHAGLQPDFIVGDPATMEVGTIKSGARVILPADTSGNAVGVDRIKELGVGALTFPSAMSSPSDLAMLMADHCGAELVVNVGATVSLHEVLVDGGRGNPGAVLTRLRLGSRLIDGDAVIGLYRVGSGTGTAWLWAVLSILVAAAVIVVIVGFGGDDTFVRNLIDTWNSIALGFQGLFR